MTKPKKQRTHEASQATNRTQYQNNSVDATDADTTDTRPTVADLIAEVDAERASSAPIASEPDAQAEPAATDAHNATQATTNATTITPLPALPGYGSPRERDAARKAEREAEKARKKAERQAAKAQRAAEREGLVVFAIRLTAAERDSIHAAAGPGKATRFVRTIALAAANGDLDTIREMVASRLA